MDIYKKVENGCYQSKLDWQQLRKEAGDNASSSIQIEVLSRLQEDFRRDAAEYLDLTDGPHLDPLWLLVKDHYSTTKDQLDLFVSLVTFCEEMGVDIGGDPEEPRPR